MKNWIRGNSAGGNNRADGKISCYCGYFIINRGAR